MCHYLISVEIIQIFWMRVLYAVACSTAQTFSHFCFIQEQQRQGEERRAEERGGQTAFALAEWMQNTHYATDFWGK